MKKLRINSNLLLVNLAIFDVLHAIIGTIFATMIHLNYDDVEYHDQEFYCRTLWPLSNYAHNGSVFTVGAISVERYLKMTHFSARFTKNTSLWIIVAIHAIAATVIIPYIYVTYRNQYRFESKLNCFEGWGKKSHVQMYTISLFCVQYVVPLSTMIVFYLSGWRKLYTHNNSMIKMSEDYEKKMNWRSSTDQPLIGRDNSPLSYNPFRKSEIETDSKQSSVYCAIKDNDSNAGDQRTNETTKDYTRNLLRRSLLSNINNSSRSSYPNNGTVNQKDKVRQNIVSRYSSRRNSEAAVIQDSRKFLKSSFSSQTSFVRYRQSIRTLKMFIIMIIAFACFALPIHLARLNLIVPRVPVIVTDVFVLVSYSSAMVNCWIYGGFNSGIREAFFDILLCSCSKNEPKSHISNAFLHMTTHPCLYDVKQQELFRKRFSAFNHMFEDFTMNLDQNLDHNSNFNIKREKSNEILTSHL